MSIETIYGENILKDNETLKKDYVLVTDNIPWSLFKDEFENKPKKIVLVESLEVDYLKNIHQELDKNWEIAGLGGGSVIDAAKYFAYLNDKIPVLIPTITSSNAQFSDFISVRKDGIRVGMREEGLPKQIVVDYKLIQRSEPRLNQAGYGDMLFVKTTLNDWKIASQHNDGIPYNESIAKELDELIENAIEKAEEIGKMSGEGIKALMHLFESSTKVMTEHSKAPLDAGSEHLFAWNLEKVTNRHFVHGEIVSLGILIAAHLQGKDYEKLKKALDLAHINYKPSVLGISFEELSETLKTIEAYNKEFRNLHTVFSYIDITEEMLQEIKELLY